MSGQGGWRAEGAEVGQGVFPPVFLEDLPGEDVLHVAVVRSALPRARIRAIDVSRALAVPGVVGVYTQSELAFVAGPFAPQARGPGQQPFPERECLSGWETRYCGEPVAAVLAGSRAVAGEAALLVEVDYEPLTSLLDARAALGAKSGPRVHVQCEQNLAFRWVAVSGELDETFRRADRVIRQRVDRPRLHAAPLETRSVRAQWEPLERRLDVALPTQAPHLLRAALARALRLPEVSVRVRATPAGGSFGSKRGLHAEEVLVAALARLVSPRPVLWRESREESLRAGPQAPARSADLEVAVREDGRLLGLRCEVYEDVGAYVASPPPRVVTAGAEVFTGPYDVAAVRWACTGVYTNRPPSLATRAAGASDATYLLERALDLVAHELELDPVEVRRMNLRRTGAVSDETLPEDLPDPTRVLDRVLDRSGYSSLRGAQDARRRSGELVGIGVALCVGRAAPGPTSAPGDPAWEGALLRIGSDGSVELFTGAPSQGQRHEVFLAECAARGLGIAPEAVRVRPVDTAALQAGAGAFASRTAAVAGSAVLIAARRLERRLREVAARLLHTTPEYVERRGSDLVAGSRAVSHAEVCAAASLPGRGPEAALPWLESQVHFEPGGPARPILARVCLASVDRATGAVTIERLVGVDDCGRLLDPVGAGLQVEGGALHGLGAALLEELPVGEEGEPLVSSLRDYALPRAGQLPRVEQSFEETPSRANPLGARGLGEPAAAVVLAAVAGAVHDALRPAGVRHLDLPLRPDRVWRALRSAALQAGGP